MKTWRIMHPDGRESIMNSDPEEKIRELERFETKRIKKLKKELICSECGFPKQINREPILLKSDVFSLIHFYQEEEEMRCNECGSWKDGNTIPIVAKSIRNIVNKVKKETAKQIFNEIDKIIPRGISPYYCRIQELKKRLLK